MNAKTNCTVSFEEMHDRLDRFDSIIIPHPRMDTVEGRLESLMEQTRRVIAKNDARQVAAGNRPIKLQELWVLPIIGPSGATKSTSLSKYIDKVNARPGLAAAKSPILPVTVRNSTKTPRAIQMQILEAYGDDAADVVKRSKDYSEAVVNGGIRELARKHGTLVVALDEAHKMLRQTNGPMVKAMADALQSLVTDGIFSLALVGTDQTLRVFTATGEETSELTSRKKETVDLGAFRVDRAADRAYFFTFVDFLEEEMAKKRVVDSRIGLVGRPAERAAVFDMAGGVVGIVCRVVRLSLERAFEAGRGRLTWDDIAEGFRGWKREQEEQDGAKGHFYDPFDPKNGGAKWDTIRHVNKDFPESERIKKRADVAEEEQDEETVDA